jgi:hypothetical protein
MGKDMLEGEEVGWEEDYLLTFCRGWTQKKMTSQKLIITINTNSQS